MRQGAAAVTADEPFLLAKPMAQATREHAAAHHAQPAAVRAGTEPHAPTVTPRSRMPPDGAALRYRWSAGAVGRWSDRSVQSLSLGDFTDGEASLLRRFADTRLLDAGALRDVGAESALVAELHEWFQSGWIQYADEK